MADTKKTGDKEDIVLAKDNLAKALKMLQDEISKAEQDLSAAKSAQDPDAIKNAEETVNTEKQTLSDKVSDGLDLTKEHDFTPVGAEASKTGLYLLEKADLFNLLCIPPYKLIGEASDVETNLISEAAAYCEKRRAMLLIDPPSNWNDKDEAKEGIENIGTSSKNAALFFPD